VVNALAKQRAMLENIMRACVGLALENNMILEYKLSERGGMACIYIYAEAAGWELERRD
jgi:hypothetical protein